MNDIDLKNTTWTPIGTFSGELNGNGYVIKNLTIYDQYYNEAGLFAETDGAKIENLGIIDANISNENGNEDTGILVGYATNDTIISNCYVTGTVNGNYNYSGGLCGDISDSTIENCFADVEVSGQNYVGGLTGSESNSNISNSYSTGKVTGDANSSGGLIGSTYEGKIANSYTTASGPDIIGDSNNTNTELLNVYYDKNKSTQVGTNDGIGLTSAELQIKINNGELPQTHTLSAEQKNSTEWLTNMLHGGFIVLSKKDSNGKYYEVNIATDTSLQEVSNETELKKAEAKYEADMRKINQKDKKFDTDLAALDAERNAIKTEQETLKSIAKDNVDRTFKLFG